MTQTPTQDAERPEPPSSPPTSPPAGWRFRVGVGFFILAIVAPAGVPIVALTDLPTEWKATLSGLLLVGGPEVFSFVAIACVGKSGFEYLKARLRGLFRRRGPAKEVGRTRYHIGLAMFILPAIENYLVLYVPERIPGYAEHHIAINLTLDVVFVSSFFVLGGEFWDKFRALFIHRAKARFPEPVGAAR